MEKVKDKKKFHVEFTARVDSISDEIEAESLEEAREIAEEQVGGYDADDFVKDIDITYIAESKLVEYEVTVESKGAERVFRINSYGLENEDSLKEVGARFLGVFVRDILNISVRKCE